MRDRRKPADNTLVRLAWAVGLIWLASGTLALAQEPALRWQAPESCPSREAWLGSLRARVDPAVWSQAAPKLRASVTIEVSELRYVLALETELEGAVGQRRIEAARCEELVDASALIVALAIDPSAAERVVSATPLVAPESTPLAVPPTTTTLDTPPPVTPETPEPVAPVAPPVAPKTPEPKPAPVIPPVPSPPRGYDGEQPQAAERSRASPAARFFVRPIALLDGGTLPKLALGPSLQGGLRLGALRLELGVTYLLAQSLQAPDSGRVVGEIRWLGGNAGACYGIAIGQRLEVAPCARAELGRLWGRGRNLDEEEVSGGALWLAFTTGLRLEYELIRGLAAGIELGSALPVLDSAFTVDGVGTVHDVPSVTARASAGFTLYF